MPVRFGNGFGMKVARKPVLLGDRLGHVFEEGVLVGGLERVVILPVHLELAVRVLMVVLVRAPAELEHRNRRSR